VTDSLTAQYWEAAKADKLVAPISPNTGKLVWPPRAFAPDDLVDARWQELSGKGVVYTFSVLHRSSHRKPPVPYVVAVVRLDEGIFITTNIVRVEPAQVHIGMPVTVSFEELANGLRLPVFAPVSG
jgi:uncharacterized OB-fold protein